MFVYEGFSPPLDLSYMWTILLILKEGSFFFEESTHSMSLHKNGDWYPDQTEYVYSCTLICLDPNCKETVINLGIGGITNYPPNEREENSTNKFQDYFLPIYFYPNLKLFKYPKSIPKNISKELNYSFELFFCNPPSSANHIRIALELVLNFLKIKKFKIKNHERNRITLHRRIELLPSKYNDLKPLFYAVKWLGNAGSHSDRQLIKDNVLDSYEIMDLLLQEIYDKKQKQVKKLAKQINKKMGQKKRV